MNDSDALDESCQHLVKLSQDLGQRCQHVHAESAKLAARIVLLDQRCRDALRRAQRIQQSIPSGWRLPQS